MMRRSGVYTRPQGHFRFCPVDQPYLVVPLYEAGQGRRSAFDRVLEFVQGPKHRHFHRPKVRHELADGGRIRAHGQPLTLYDSSLLKDVSHPCLSTFH